MMKAGTDEDMKARNDITLVLFELKQNMRMLDAIMDKIYDMQDTQSVYNALYILKDNLNRVHNRVEDVIDELGSEPSKEEPSKEEPQNDESDDDAEELDTAILDMWVNGSGSEVYFARKTKYNENGKAELIYYEVGITGKGSKKYVDYYTALTEYKSLRDNY